MNDPLVAEVVRGSIVESVHLADFAIVDAAGVLVDSAGDPLIHAAFRSTAKPIQASVLLESGWAPDDDRCVAIACASHNGEPEHVALVNEILQSAGLDESALLCPLALPNVLVPEALARAGEPAARYHNCSGKHAAMLATCKERGWPLGSYREAQHPIQQAIHEALEHASGSLLEAATDGCGVVTYAAPLAAIARGFGAIHTEPTFKRAADAMRHHPFLIGGTHRLSTALMQSVPRLTVKGGAEGLLCVAGDAFSLALKSRDGSSRALGVFALELLRRMHAVPDPLPDSLVLHARPSVRGGGRVVGEIRLRP